jgi:hypothetical protein
VSVINSIGAIYHNAQLKLGRTTVLWPEDRPP